MQKFVDLLTDAQKDKLKNCYIITQDNELCKLTLDEGDELTTENFKVLFPKTDEGLMVAMVDNICFYDPNEGDFDFKVGIDGDWFDRNEAPYEVVEFLDEVLNKAKYKK